MKPMKYGHLSIPALLTFALAGGACKNDCQKAIDHVTHLSWVEVQNDPDVKAIPPAMRAEVDKMMNEEKAAPQMRQILVERFGARCNDPAFTKCLLASKDMGGVANCEHPLTPDEIELSKKSGGR